MSTTAEQQTTNRTATAQPTPQQSPTLDAVIAATPTRAQSIRTTAAMFLGVPPEKVCDLLRNVWKTSKGQPPLTDQEMFMGMSLVSRYGLDPIAREVYVTRDGKGRLLTIIGIDGWIKILDRTEHYDGFEQELRWNAAGDKLECVTTRIYSKLRSRPAVYEAFASEYAKLGGFVADTIPWHMLRLFSLRHAARLFTPIGGSVVTEEEARWASVYDRDEHAATAPTVAQLESRLNPRPNGSASNGGHQAIEEAAGAEVGAGPNGTEPDGEEEPIDCPDCGRLLAPGEVCDCKAATEPTEPDPVVLGEYTDLLAAATKLSEINSLLGQAAGCDTPTRIAVEKLAAEARQRIQAARGPRANRRGGELPGMD